MFNIFELTPLVAGCLVAALIVSNSRRLTFPVAMTVLVAVGIACSFLAGEWSGGPAAATVAVLWDSGKAAAGFALGSFFAKARPHEVARRG